MIRTSGWIPTVVGRRVRVLAWLSLITEIVIVGTGGAVRLTESGLGCSTWPTCSADSLVPTPELGIHGLIEFGNRLMTGVVGIVAVLMLLVLLKLRRERPGLFGIAVALVIAVAAQALVGGITVLSGLNPFIVGFHFAASLIMVVLSAILVVRSYAVPGPRRFAAPHWYFVTSLATAALLAVTITMGVLTTASGPHSGDPEAARTGFDAFLFEHLHAWPGYFSLAGVVVLAAASVFRGLRSATWTPVLLLLVLAQIAVGLIQSNTGLPPLLVGVHMILACLIAATMAVVLLSELEPAEADNAGNTDQNGSSGSTAMARNSTVR